MSTHLYSNPSRKISQDWETHKKHWMIRARETWVIERDDGRSDNFFFQPQILIAFVTMMDKQNNNLYLCKYSNILSSVVRLPLRDWVKIKGEADFKWMITWDMKRENEKPKVSRLRKSRRFSFSGSFSCVARVRSKIRIDLNAITFRAHLLRASKQLKCRR
jgi:hypothetical protein